MGKELKEWLNLLEHKMTTFNEMELLKKVRTYLEEYFKYKELDKSKNLYIKVYVLKDWCNKPTDCGYDCEFCDSNTLDIEEDFILYSDFNKEIHYLSMKDAENALEKKEKDN